MILLSLLLSMAAMIVAAEVFTNAVEWLGHRLRLGDSATGSVLAAVGTALPETLVPIVALAGGGEGAHAVTVGAILGAPFMLATVALFLSGAAAVLFRGLRHSNLELDLATTRQDAGVFLLMFALLVTSTALPAGWPRWLVAAALLASYGWYVRRLLTSGPAHAATPRRLYFGGSSPRVGVIVLQLLLSIGLLAAAAHYFVGAIESVAAVLGLPLLALSLLLVPLATELPEKFNSIIWLHRRQDTLALGNITGAMVFQTAIPGSVGLLFTDWRLDSFSWLTAGFTLAAMLALWTWLATHPKLPAAVLLPNCGFYLLFAALVLR
ncbi:MAG TPA: sodium:calcium antiporter [Chloroflexota bacterium]|nr:sodium:calcium antiporter [Chloroflexota bacterium]